MTEAEKQYIRDVVENEGFIYGMIHYTDFPEVKDEVFHALRKTFEVADKRLSASVNAVADLEFKWCNDEAHEVTPSELLNGEARLKEYQAAYHALKNWYDENIDENE